MTWTAFKKGIAFLEAAFNISPKLDKTETASLYHALKDKIRGDENWLFLVKVLRDTTDWWNPRREGYNPVGVFLRLYREYPYEPSRAEKKKAEDARLKELRELRANRAAKMVEGERDG